MPADAKICLMGDRFYGTADPISLCQERGWSYWLRLKGTSTVKDRAGRTTTAARAMGEIRCLEDVELTARRAKMHIGIIRDPGHDQPWIVAMSEKPSYLTTLDYSGRWGSSRCSPTSSRAGSASKIRRSNTLTGSPACCSSRLSSSTAPFRPACGTRPTIPPRRKKVVKRQPAKMARSKVS